MKKIFLALILLVGAQAQAKVDSRIQRLVGMYEGIQGSCVNIVDIHVNVLSKPNPRPGQMENVLQVWFSADDQEIIPLGQGSILKSTANPRTNDVVRSWETTVSDKTIVSLGKKSTRSGKLLSEEMFYVVMGKNLTITKIVGNKFDTCVLKRMR